MKKNKIIIISCLISFTIILILYLFNGLNKIDTYVYNLIITLKSNKMTSIMKFITFFGSAELTLIILIILTLSIIKVKKSIIIIYTIIGESILNYSIKILVKRERPNILRLVKESSYSFPSGHTMLSIVLYGFLIYLVNKRDINKRKKIFINIILTLIPLFIMISRIYLGIHYFSDVISGMFLGIAYLLIVIDYIERKKII